MSWSLYSFPRAILHIDGDAFFASCEIALNPKLKGKPVVTGKERGIASSMSYEAKAKGVTRGMILSDVRKYCPDAVILPSDYETYSLFSKRMYAVVRRYTPAVEEYSIDECFADLTGLRRPLRMSYRHMAERIKHELDSELGMTFSVGLAPNKVLGKVASKWKKPSGLTIIPARDIEEYLRDLPLIKIWGIGPQTTQFLNKMGVATAYAYANKPQEWIAAHMSKPYKEIWQELRGEFVYPLNLEEKHDYQTISKTKTFTPPSRDPGVVFSQLSKNIENACIKARRHGLAPKKIYFFLKTQNFDFSGLELELTSPLSAPHEMVRLVRSVFHKVFRPRFLYRATGAILMDLRIEGGEQLDLFGKVAELHKWKPVYATVDMLDGKFGKHTVFLGSTLKAMRDSTHTTTHNTAPGRTQNLFKGENSRQRVGIPMLGDVK
ncbi:MAG TPA: DNA polymerase IV [Candidatus Paceibacterota bacterium]|nr:DNA polymerase IV [Candidatus Paceibacterota bacterium]